MPARLGPLCTCTRKPEQVISNQSPLRHPPAKLCLHALYLVRWLAFANGLLSLYLALYLVPMPSLQTSHVNFISVRASGTTVNLLRELTATSDCATC